MHKHNNNLFKIIELLNDNRYHDGTSIGSTLDITRAGVWKSIQKIQKYGINIKSVKGKGYLLEAPLILLDYCKIKSSLKEKNIKLDIIEKIDSTNNYFKKDAIRSNGKVGVCISEMQTEGKGRMSRKWYSPFGKNIYLSILYSFQKDISELSGLSLIISLGVCRSIESLCQLNNKLSIKWPNDIVFEQQKIAGILIEIQAESNGFCNAIIGIGINVNMDEAHNKQISQKWTSLQKLTGQYYDRNFLCSGVINHTIEYLDRFMQFGLDNFIGEWVNKDYLFGKQIKVISGGNRISGVGSGINNSGHLILKMPEGTTTTLSSGDTTIVK